MEENVTQEKFARSSLFWLWLSVVVITLVTGISFLWFSKLRITGGILLSVSVFLLLRFFFGFLSVTKFCNCCVVGLIIGMSFAIFPIETSKNLLYISLSVSFYILLFMLLWSTFKIKRETSVSWLHWTSIALTLFGILFILVIYTFWLDLQLWLDGKISDEISKKSLFSDRLYWLHIGYYSIWLRIIPLYLFLLSFALYRGALPFGRNNIYPKRLGSLIIMTGLLTGLFIVVLQSDFDLRQRFSSLFCREEYYLQFEPADANVAPYEIDECISIIRYRLDPEALGGVNLKVSEDNTISLGIDKAWTRTLPDEFVREACEERGILEFRILAQKDKERWSNIDSSQLMSSEEINNYVSILKSEGPLFGQNEPYRWFTVSEDIAEKIKDNFIVESYGDERYVLAYNIDQMCMLQDGSWYIISANDALDRLGRRCINFTLSKEGADKMRMLTQPENFELTLAILIDDRVYASPRIESRVSSSCQITGNFTSSEVYSLVKILSCKPLPLDLKFNSKNITDNKR